MQSVTHARTDGQVQTNMLPQLLQVGEAAGGGGGIKTQEPVTSYMY